jgi:hypothetical protein
MEQMIGELAEMELSSEFNDFDGNRELFPRL